MFRHFIFIQILVILITDIVFNKNIFSFVTVLHNKYNIALLIYPVFLLFISIIIFFLTVLAKEIIKSIRNKK